jgi:hypothetical protein
MVLYFSFFVKYSFSSCMSKGFFSALVLNRIAMYNIVIQCMFHHFAQNFVQKSLIFLIKLWPQPVPILVVKGKFVTVLNQAECHEDICSSRGILHAFLTLIQNGGEKGR